MNKRSGVFGYGSDDIAEFKRRWPCHGFPDTLNCVVAAFANNGDLVELEAFDKGGDIIETRDFDGSDLLALVDDIQAFGYIARPGSAENYYD